MNSPGTRPQTLLVRNADVLVTMDGERREIRGGGLFAEGNRIISVGESSGLPQTADRVLDLAGHVVVPGLVNTHHHMFQCLTRALPGAQDAGLFAWLEALFPVWARMTPEMLRVATTTAMAELVLSGCTTSSDHLYLFPQRLPPRRHDPVGRGDRHPLPCDPREHERRQSGGGLPPDSLVENEASILRDCQRVVVSYNDPGRFAMVRVGVAPCSPFCVSKDLMRESAVLARSLGVRLHTHLAETDDDVAYCVEKFGRTPAEYAEELGWTGRDVWHAHCVKLDDAGIELFARTGTGIAHCPCSNMRLGSGTAPVRRMLARRVPVGLGVDGSSSNDSGDLLAEARQAMLLQRVGLGAGAMTARQALEIATIGGARVLGRDDVGCLAPGMAADFSAFDVRGAGFAGALHDPVAALVFCAPERASWVCVNGRLVVEEGRLATVDLVPHLERHNRLARRLVSG